MGSHRHRNTFTDTQFHTQTATRPPTHTTRILGKTDAASQGEKKTKTSWTRPSESAYFYFHLPLRFYLFISLLIHGLHAELKFWLPQTSNGVAGQHQSIFSFGRDQRGKAEGSPVLFLCSRTRVATAMTKRRRKREQRREATTRAVNYANRLIANTPSRLRSISFNLLVKKPKSFFCNGNERKTAGETKGKKDWINQKRIKLEGGSKKLKKRPEKGNCPGGGGKKGEGTSTAPKTPTD